MKNHIKFHALTMVSPLNAQHKYSQSDFIDRLVLFFGKEKSIAIEQEVKRLLDTKQLKLINGVIREGEPIFEEAVPISKAAESAATAIWENLLGRRGIGNELEELDADVQNEIRNTIGALIDKSYS